MTDWDSINKRKRLEINLGQAKNQAVQACIARRTMSLEKDYKEYVKLFFKWNMELDAELLK